METETSTQILVKDLEAHTELTNNPFYVQVLEQARNEHYHEFKTSLATPIYVLVQHLETLGLFEMAKQAKLGKYDASEQEAKDWVNSSEGQATLAGINKNLPFGKVVVNNDH